MGHARFESGRGRKRERRTGAILHSAILGALVHEMIAALEPRLESLNFGLASF